MAKELPYFKFEPNAWENGNIQMLSREDKGLFIDICSMFWSRIGDLPEKLVIQKLCFGNASALIPLYDEKIIELIDGSIYVKFLSIQLQEFENTSNQNSENAKERWRKYREQKEISDRNATALIPQCEIDAIREEKRREEKRREEKKKENNKSTTFSFYNSLIYIGAESKLANEWLAVRKKKKATDTETAFDGFVREMNKGGLDINSALRICIEKSWSGLNASWLKGLEITPQSVEAEKIDFEKLKDFISQKTGRDFKVINEEIKNKYYARLKEGYSKQDILDAVSNAVKSDYHKGENFKYLTPEFFSRSETLDKYSNTNNKPKENNVKSLIPKGVSYSGPQY